MTREELEQARAEQTPLYECYRDQLVVVDPYLPPIPTSCYVTSLHDRREKYLVRFDLLRPATAQELLELGDSS